MFVRIKGFYLVFLLIIFFYKKYDRWSRFLVLTKSSSYPIRFTNNLQFKVNNNISKVSNHNKINK